MPEAGQAPQSQNAARKLRVVMAQLDFLVGDIPGNTDLILEAAQRAWDCLLYTFRAHETKANLVCRLLLEKKKTNRTEYKRK